MTESFPYLPASRVIERNVRNLTSQEPSQGQEHAPQRAKPPTHFRRHQIPAALVTQSTRFALKDKHEGLKEIPLYGEVWHGMG